MFKVIELHQYTPSASDVPDHSTHQMLLQGRMRTRLGWDGTIYDVGNSLAIKTVQNVGYMINFIHRAGRGKIYNT